MARALTVVLFAALVSGVATTGGCGAAARSGEGAESSRGRRHEPVELTVRTPDGGLLFVGDLRGRPVLLFVFATFDGVSQAALHSLRRFTQHYPRVHVVGVAMQPNAESLIGAWAHALSPPFPVGYEPEERLEKGTTALGTIEAVPSFILLNSRGYEVKRHTGFASIGTLEHMLRETRPPDGGMPDGDAGQPPLIGKPPPEEFPR